MSPAMKLMPYGNAIGIQVKINIRHQFALLDFFCLCIIIGSFVSTNDN